MIKDCAESKSFEMNHPPSMDREETFLKLFEFMELQISLCLIKHISTNR